MKQVLQSLSSGTTELSDVPVPRLSQGHLLIRTTRSLISAGTERMLVDFGKANLVEKARQQPEKVKMVLDKARTDGVMTTFGAVRNKLDQPLAMGYCNVGVVTTLGSGVRQFAIGDRVASNGKHAEVVAVPVNLCARIPASVSDDEAAFTVMAAIGLQGIRLAAPTLGECVVVTGLGLIGLLTVQLLRAHGCRVLGIDMDPARLALARQFGAETVDLAIGQDPVVRAGEFSRDRGVDAVIITASTSSSEPMHQAALMSRKRGRVVLVGVAGLELSRADFYEKELSFQVSCSYGPGRYDPAYEEAGQDYPVGFVRWTEQRNFEAVLDMMSDGRLGVKPLISHSFALEDFGKAYDLVSGSTPSLGILLEYPSVAAAGGSSVDGHRVRVNPSPRATGTVNGPSVAFIGAGNYATAVLVPAFKAAGAKLASVASSAGVSGLHAARKFGFEETTTAAEELFVDPSVDAIVITTRHDSHARFVMQALNAGKHVFVEKPLCLRLDELSEIETAYAAAGVQLMVGFNRRFAPQIVKMKALLAALSGPRAFVMTINAGSLPTSHWTQDPDVGGGRIVGEACHFVDLLRFLADCPIVSWSRASMASPTNDTATVQLGFADGSIGSIHYLANGTKAFPKERLEVFAQGRVLQLDNYRKLRGYGWPGFTRMNLWQQDKGQKACADAFVRAVRSGTHSPIPIDEILEVSRISIELGSSV